MTIPKRQAYNCKRGFLAQADVGVNSPKTENSQSVNVVVNNIPQALTQDKNNILQSRDVKIEEVQTKDITLTKENRKLDPGENLAKTINDNLENETIVERDIASAKKNVEDLQNLVKTKDNLIEALSLILDMYENNPLIVNKLIIPAEDELLRLLFLLTNADEIELVKLENEVGCTCKPAKFTAIQKVMVKKGENLYNFKYSFPNAVQLLDNRRISWKLVC